MDLGQECSWFLEDRDPWTPDSHPELRSWPRPLNQESPSLFPSNPPSGECWYPREMSEPRKPFKNPIQRFHPSFNPWSMTQEFPSDKARLKNQGKDSCHSCYPPQPYTLPAVSQDTFTVTRWPPQVPSGPCGSQDGSEFRTVWAKCHMMALSRISFL